jgi:hypothetical protein
MLPDSFPAREYRESVERERIARDAAFLPVREFISVFEVWPMNLRHYVALRTVHNPLLFGIIPQHIEHVAQFLWTVSVDYRPSRDAQVEWFNRSGLIEPKEPRLRTRLAMARRECQMRDCGALQARVIRDSQRYVADALADRPPRQAASGKSYYSDACFWCAMMGREYGTSIAEVMEMPLKQLFQFLKEIKEHNGKRDSLSNPSDAVIATWQAQQQKRN